MDLDIFRSAISSPAAFSLEETVVQAVMLICLSVVLSLVYVLRGNSLSNRARLAALLPLMAITTMLIISIVKSSLALSLGLVGALSIVRFRAAIKDPEELAYIFLAIALGLGFGAEQVPMTTTFFVIIVTFILVQSLLRGRLGTWFTDKDAVHLELNFSKNQSLTEVVNILQKHSKKMKLTRVEHASTHSMFFLVTPQSEKSLEQLMIDLSKLDTKLTQRVVQYQPVA